MVKHLLWVAVFLYFYHHAHRTTRTFVAQVANADFLFLVKFCDFFYQARLVHAIRNFRNYNLVAPALCFLNLGHTANRYASAPGLIGLLHWRTAVNGRTSWEIRATHVPHQIVDRNIVVINNFNRCINQFAQVMRRNIGRHTDRDTNLAVEQQVWQFRWQHNRLALRTVKVITKINRFFFDIYQHIVGWFSHAGLGVTHRRWLVAVHRTKVTLALNKRIAERPPLRQTHHRVINRRVAVRVIFTHHVTNNTS